MTSIMAEYIWPDGTKPMPLLRSKTKVMKKGDKPGIWAFDGSSTNQATGDKSDCVLKPVFTCPDPLRGGDNILVLCEVELVDGKPHPTNTRAPLRAVAEKYADFKMWYGLEQEYTLLQKGIPLGFPKDGGYPAPQGPYYCGTGADHAFGRTIADRHLAICLQIGIKLAGINAEVMPGQWEFQCGPLGPLEIGDHMAVARYLLGRVAEAEGVQASFEAKPMKGDWNGAGCHTNFSTRQMRESYDACEDAAKALSKEVDKHIAAYGPGTEERLTGAHETCAYTEFRYGVSDRGASVRIPWQVAKDRKGYIEDRRPNASCDPYLVARVILETVCSAAKK